MAYVPGTSHETGQDAWTPFCPAIGLEQWDRQPDPALAPRKDGRRLSGCTREDCIRPIIEDGRKYQGFMPGEYHLPMDGLEQDRLDFQHQAFKLLHDGRLSIIPFETPPTWVLDIGTGTGIWALEFAEQNPASHVFGTDLSAIQPEPCTPNCTWILENSEKQEWTYFEPLDYIHLRSIGPCFDDFGAVLRKCYDNMRPGGWIELQDGCMEVRDVDGTSVGTAIPEFFSMLCLGAANMGRDLLKPKFFQSYLEAVGFVQVQVVEIAMPGSPWPQDPKMKLCGYFLGRATEAASGAYKKFLDATGLPPEEIYNLIERLKKDLERVDIHWYLPFFTVIARKPFEAPMTFHHGIDPIPAPSGNMGFHTY